MTSPESGPGRARKAGRFLQLPTHRQTALLGAVAALLVVRTLVAVVPFGVVRAVLARIARPRVSTAATGRDIHECVWAVETVSRRVPGTTCLTKSLAGQVVLERNGHDSVLRIGVTRGEDGLTAHSWLEHQGEVVVGNAADLSEYTLLPPVEMT